MRVRACVCVYVCAQRTHQQLKPSDRNACSRITGGKLAFLPYNLAQLEALAHHRLGGTTAFSRNVIHYVAAKVWDRELMRVMFDDVMCPGSLATDSDHHWRRAADD